MESLHRESGTFGLQGVFCDDLIDAILDRLGATGLQRLPTQASSNVFDMNSTGMELLYMDSANVPRYHNAVMKDAGGVPYLLQFKAIVATGESPVLTLAKTQMNAPRILQMTAAAGSTPWTPSASAASSSRCSPA
jgi:hypothetical protein